MFLHRKTNLRWPSRLLPWLPLLAFNTLIVAQEVRLELAVGNGNLESNIRAHLDLTEINCQQSRAALTATLPTIEESVIRAGQALGYYYLEQQISVEFTEDCWTVKINVTPGEAITIGEVNIELNSNEQLFSNLLNNLPVTVGDQLNHANYERVKSELSTQAVQNGFFSARFISSQLQLDLQQNLATINIEFDPGQQFEFSNVNIAEIDVLSSSFIRRYVNIESGTPYSSKKIIEQRDVLNDSLYFSNVTVTPVLDDAINQAVPIEIGLSARPRRAYSAGVGVATDIGPRVRVDYQDRYFNRRGHTIGGQIVASPVRQLLDLNYTMPMQKPATESLRFSAGFLAEDNDTFKQKTSMFGATYSFINSFNWRQKYFTNYQHDDYRINNQDEVSDLLIGGINLERTQADDALYPEKGWRVFAQLRGASSDILSTKSFAQFYLSGKLINKFGPGRLLLKLEAGTTLVDDIAELPVSIQYFAGGDQSVRGYKYQSLGPRNKDGEVEGGKHLLVASIEYDFAVWEDWKLAFFVDAGNAFNEFKDYELKKSAGIGIRWLSPIGPIRADLASALDNDNRLRLHITMGPDL